MSPKLKGSGEASAQSYLNDSKGALKAIGLGCTLSARKQVGRLIESALPGLSGSEP